MRYAVFAGGKAQRGVRRFIHEGRLYRATSGSLRAQLAGSGAAGFAGNVVAGGVIGMGVDVATGAALEHTPNPVFVALEPERRPPARHANGSTIRARRLTSEPLVIGR